MGRMWPILCLVMCLGLLLGFVLTSTGVAGAYSAPVSSDAKWYLTPTYLGTVPNGVITSVPMYEMTRSAYNDYDDANPTTLGISAGNATVWRADAVTSEDATFGSDPWDAKLTLQLGEGQALCSTNEATFSDFSIYLGYIDINGFHRVK